jgi:homocysteine S-methyltransferase
MLVDYIKNNILITDGAMGTYYSELTGDRVFSCEFSNINNPEVIKDIHNRYIEAGAKLIRTNTFSANSLNLDVDNKTVKQIIQKGYNIAKEAALGKEVFVAASIGPIINPTPDNDNVDILAEYKFVVDCFLELGTEIFIFETFSNLNYLEEIAGYIKEKNKEALIFTDFAIMPDGFTRDGISISRIEEEINKIEVVDIHGYNCGSGPAHLYDSLKKIGEIDKTIAVLPNASYPEIVNERTIFVNNPTYFAEKMIDIKNLGVKILGGCCGTTPEHIKALVKRLNNDKTNNNKQIVTEVKETEILAVERNNFQEKLKNNEFVIAVELDPPFNTDIKKIIAGAKLCKENGIDLVTIADSPMSKVRVDSVAIATKIKREIGIDTMPHICCRDKNINAIRSTLLAAHIEGIRNILAVTGDPIPAEERTVTKGVFNLNSFKLIELISQMNDEFFGQDEISIGGALNLNVVNKNSEVNRMYRKSENGATFFLTQPIYDQETIEYLKGLKKEGVKILGGILPIVSYRNAQFLNNELPGVHIPEEYIKRFSPDMSKEEAEDVGIQMAVEIGEKIKPYVDGIYFMTPFNRVEMIIKIMKKLIK